MHVSNPTSLPPSYEAVSDVVKPGIEKVRFGHSGAMLAAGSQPRKRFLADASAML